MSTGMARDPRAPSDGQVPSRPDPDRALKWLLSFVLGGVAVNLLSSAIETQGWALVPPIVFAVAAMTVAPRTGLLRREPHVGSRWTRLLALACLLIYLGAAAWGTATAWPLPVMLLSTSFLWATCVLVTWPSLRSQQPLSVVAVGVAGLLFGVAGLLFGVAVLRDGGDALVGVAGLLFGVAGLLFGVAGLLVGVAGLRDEQTLLGVVGIGLLFGIAVLLVGVATLTLFGVARLLGGIALLLILVGMLCDVRDRDPSVFLVPIMVLGGVAMLLFGVAKLRDGDTLVGVAGLLYGVACLQLFGVGWLRSEYESKRPTTSALFRARLR